MTIFNDLHSDKSSNPPDLFSASSQKIKKRVVLSAMNKPSLPLDLRKLSSPSETSTGNTNRAPSKRGAMTHKPEMPALGAKIQSVGRAPRNLGPGELPEEEREPQKINPFHIPNLPEREIKNKPTIEKPPDKQGASCPVRNQFVKTDF